MPISAARVLTFAAEQLPEFRVHVESLLNRDLCFEAWTGGDRIAYRICTNRLMDYVYVLDELAFAVLDVLQGRKYGIRPSLN